MKYYSESLQKFFDSEAECAKAEAEYTEKRAAEEKERDRLMAQRDQLKEQMEELYGRYLECKKRYEETCEELKPYGKLITIPIELNTSMDWEDIFNKIFGD